MLVHICPAPYSRGAGGMKSDVNIIGRAAANVTLKEDSACPLPQCWYGAQVSCVIPCRLQNALNLIALHEDGLVVTPQAA